MRAAPPTILNELIETFDSSQFEAYGYDGNCVVLAGPGSGKTRVLVGRVARLMTHRAKGPRGVACLTFNNDTVREVKNRLGDVGFTSDRRLYIGTVHGFCLECVVAPFARLLRKDLPATFTVAGTSQQKLALRQAVNELGLSDQFSDFRGPMTNYRRTHLDRNSDKWVEDNLLAKLVEYYEKNLRQNGMLDFDDLALVALDMIRQEGFVRSALEARFPYLVIDEYQDLGKALHLIVCSLSKLTDIEVFVVGDPDQSIYGFAAASPQYLQELAQDSAFHKITLDLNYRSVKQIIDGAQVLLESDVSRNYKSVRENATGGLYFQKCPGGLRDQAKFIATLLIPRLEKNGIPPDQIAVLFLDKWDARVLRKALDEAGVRYADARDQRYSRTPFARWLEDLALWCSLYPENQTGPSIDELFGRHVVQSEEADVFVEFGDLGTRARFFETLTSISDPRIPLLEWLNRLDSSLNMTECLHRRGLHPDDLAAWESIIEYCGEGEPFAEFDLERFASRGGRIDSVVLTSLHSSKGLEYQVVIMPGLEQGRLPRFNANTEQEIAEARRAFYVGMTRAKDSLYLLYSGWYENSYGRVFSYGPSCFVRELKKG